MTEPLLEIKNLDVFFGESHVVRNANFALEAGQTVALVGESGSGKSVSALSIMRLLAATARHSDLSSIRLRGEELLNKSENAMRAVRGSDIGMIFQEPLTALNPLHTIERQIAEPLFVHQNMNKEQARKRVLELLDMVELEGLSDRLGAYPHELSGGQRQRVMIAMALANAPDILIADEPTTALDVTVEVEILKLLKNLQEKNGMGLLLITHDLGVVRQMADYVCVMERGEIVEQGPVGLIFETPKHAYTRRLLGAQPSGKAVASNPDAPVILEGTDIRIHFPKRKNFFGKVTGWVKAVDNIDIVAKKGQTLGVVGESGSGKSTLGYGLIRLLKPEGRIVFMGRDIAALDKKELKKLRADIQIVFQDPFGSLSPRMTVADIIGEGLSVHRPNLNAQERDALVVEALEEVQMDPEARHRYPHEFSGGQRQRISIARALILKPDFIVLDEPTSALDVSVQAEIVNLLRKLQSEHGISYMFISHDLRVVRAMSHDIIVMKDGRVVESGPSEQIFKRPKESYTQRLLSAALR